MNIPIHTVQNDLLPFTRHQFKSLDKAELETLVRAPLHRGEDAPPLTVTLASGPIDRVLVRFHEAIIEYVVPTEFPNEERLNFFTNRWLCTRPLFARVRAMHPTLTGTCLLWLNDVPTGPGLCFSGNGVSHLCIPDSVFLETLGYHDLRNAMQANCKPWSSRSSTVFWRGASTGQRQSSWRDIQRLHLCTTARNVGEAARFDIGISQIVQIWDEQERQEIVESGILKQPCPSMAFIDYKYAVDVDGNSCSWPGLFTKLLMRNTVIKLDSAYGFRQWYYERLKAWENYIPMSAHPTERELQEIAVWLQNNDEWAEEIAIQGQALAQQLTWDVVLSDSASDIRNHIDTVPNALAEAIFFATSNTINIKSPGEDNMKSEDGGNMEIETSGEPSIALSVIDTSPLRPLVTQVRAALHAAILGDGKLDPEILAIPGMSGKKYRLFINNLVGACDDARYLEIGSWMGSTLCAAIYKNQVRALAIDNWSEFGGPADKFLSNLSMARGAGAIVSFIENDFRKVELGAVGKFNIYLFDGPHESRDQCDGILLAYPALDDEFVLIVDDWNWERVREGTFQGIGEAGIELDFVVEVRTSLDDTHPVHAGPQSDWHNGYLIAVCHKVFGETRSLSSSP